MEIEAKFSLPDPKTFRRLQAVAELAGMALGALRTEIIRDTYLDTPDRALLAAGYACRRRASLGQVLITVKQLGSAVDAVHRREEYEFSAPADQPPAGWLPGRARDLVLGLIGARPLEPLLELRQTRVVRAMSRRGRSVATMSLDRVRLGSEPRVFFFRELEIELGSQGTEDDLTAVVSSLQHEWKLQPEPRSKFERALDFINKSVVGPPRSVRVQVKGRSASTPKSSGPGVKPNDSMTKAARKLLWFHFQRMVSHEPGTREGKDAEELHDMRVATRRLRAALRIFDAYLDQDSIKPFARSLRRAARLLGAVRDLDVFCAKAQPYRDRLPDERKTELDALFAAFQVQYERARGELLAYLDTDDYQLFKRRFDEFLRTPGAGAVPKVSKRRAPLPYRVRHVLPQVVFEYAAHVRAYGEWMRGPDVPLTRYHQLRIACKQLRYALEFFREVLGPDVEGLIEKTKALQDRLGNLQDALVACQILRNFLNWGTWERHGPTKTSPKTAVVVAPGVAIYLASRQSEIQELLDGFSSVWRPVGNRKFSRRLAATVAL